MVATTDSKPRQQMTKAIARPKTRYQVEKVVDTEVEPTRKSFKRCRRGDTVDRGRRLSEE